MERFKLKVAVYALLIKEDKILLCRRFNTGWQDENYGLPSGHLESNETVTEALLREVSEEVGIRLNLEDVEFVHAMHRKSNYIDLFFAVRSWAGEPKILEPDKCDDMQWFPLNSLPSNIVPSVRSAIQNHRSGILFSEPQSED